MIDDVVAKQMQLSQKQKEDLQSILSKHAKLFDGTLGVYHHRKFNIEQLENAQPVHSRPHSVPRIHLKVFRKELKHLVK